MGTSGVRLTIHRSSGRSQTMDADGHTAQNLSPRQHDVLRLIVRGLSNKEIARALNLAEAQLKFTWPHCSASLAYIVAPPLQLPGAYFLCLRERSTRLTRFKPLTTTGEHCGCWRGLMHSRSSIL